MAASSVSRFRLLRNVSNDKLFNSIQIRWISQGAKFPMGPFGFLFDIDGVLTRGRTVLPYTKHAFRLLTDSQGQFRVPTVFVTNAGNTLRNKKAEALSNMLGIEIAGEQVVMSHSPLKLYKTYHDKRVLISGQGPIVEIARNLGFTNVTTVDQLRHSFPTLDMVDHKRRKTAPCAFEKYFPPIEAVVLFGEPIRWETHLQLITDVLLTSGKPSAAPDQYPYPHIPVLCCNTDLFWMAEAPMPRFGHGTFILCLEALYKKITGKDLNYAAVLGKPSVITYHHAEYCLEQHAKSIGIKMPIRTLYAVGDNPETDICGANSYDEYLREKLVNKKRQSEHVAQQRAKKLGTGNGNEWAEATSPAEMAVGSNPLFDPISELVSQLDESELSSETCAERCFSILVRTGVYCEEKKDASGKAPASGAGAAAAGDVVKDKKMARAAVNHGHRDSAMNPELRQPAFVVHNVLEAVQLSFEREKFC